MKRRPASKKAVIGTSAGVVLLLGAAALVLSEPDRTLAASGGFVRDGRAGFVVTDFNYALGPDHSETGACKTGFSKSSEEIYAASPEGQRRRGEDDEQYGERIQDGGRTVARAPDGTPFCARPDLAPPDPHTRLLLDASAVAEGIDLDGKTSRSRQDLQSARLDFNGPDGTTGIDNQFWRLVGCNKSFQSDGISRNGLSTAMYTGAWGILIALEDVDDLRNDDHVKVGIHANADPIQLSPTREALEYATYAIDQDPAYRAITTGRIEGGVLTTEPVDVQFHHDVNGMYLQRPLRDARIRATLSSDGVLKGYLGGFTPVRAFYDMQFGFRNGKNADGTPSPPKRVLNSANGASNVLGHTCQGMYQGLLRLADGHRDTETGKFTSVSTQYRFEARPAFVVDVETRSKNEKLVRK